MRNYNWPAIAAATAAVASVVAALAGNALMTEAFGWCGVVSALLIPRGAR